MAVVMPGMKKEEREQTNYSKRDRRSSGTFGQLGHDRLHECFGKPFVIPRESSVPEAVHSASVPGSLGYSINCNPRVSI
jgi:hypothetical protein